ncbi:MAG: lysophospholipid acyltransferase family protein [Candidatus Kapaibacteriales bacterium]
MIKDTLVKNLAYNLINFISKTWRLKFSNFPPKSSIIVFWHGDMLPIWKLFSNFNAFAVVSLSPDGEILSNLLSKWGYRLIRGSSTKGGKEVLTRIIEEVKNSYVLITPDGPRGPKNKMKPGALIASIRSGCPIYVCRVTFSNSYCFKRSWDNFKFPLPFSKIKVEFLGPFLFENTEDRNKTSDYIKAIESILNS